MFKQNPLRRCTPALTSRRLGASARALLAALLTACTPLTGAKSSEQSQEPPVAVEPGHSAPDAGARAPETSETDAGATDHSARGTTGGSGGAAKPKDPSSAGRAGDVSMSMSMNTDVRAMATDPNAGAAAKGGDTGASNLVDVTCVPLFVQEARGQFVQVRCQTAIALGADQVEYLALPTNTLAAACTRFSQLASAALLRAAPIGVRVSAAGRGNDSGCETARCRTIRAFSQGM